MLHRNSLKHYVHLFNNFTDISEERQQLKQLSWWVSRRGIVGPWELRDIANMDQTPLQFCFNTKGATYAETEEKSQYGPGRQVKAMIRDSAPCN